ncbi:MAG: DUF362 domain-containing protein [bacterium]
MNKCKKLSFAGGEGRKNNIKRCLALIQEDLESIRTAQDILIKPNLVGLKPEYANTHVEAIEAVIEFLRTIVPETHITVGEGAASAFYRGMSTTTVFEDYDYCRLEKKYNNVSLTHFDNDKEFIYSPILSVVGDTRLRITKRANDFDYKISLSIPKTHNFAIATFGIKNMAGLVMRQDMAMIHGMKGGVEVDAPKTLLDRLPAGTVSRARRILPNGFINFLFRQYPAYRKSVKMIHRNIAEFAKKLWPDLVVLDGMVCMENDGPVNGAPLPMNCAIASTDPLKADSLGARLLGFQPEEIGYLYYLQEEGMGECSLDGLLGDDWHKFAKQCKRHGTYDIQREWR